VSSTAPTRKPVSGDTDLPIPGGQPFSPLEILSAGSHNRFRRISHRWLNWCVFPEGA